ncbi:MAG: hypothetical protein JNL89_03980, partial [Rhodanobacteraceae bacterium]|nr:hypothetical protein [Rhodanobacteraceae bacterium]
VRRIDFDGPLPPADFRHPGIVRHVQQDGGAHWIVDGLDDAAIAALAGRFGSVPRAQPMSLEDIFIELG